MRNHEVKPQVSQHSGKGYQVTESGLTEPGLQADSPLATALTCWALGARPAGAGIDLLS